MTLVVRDHCLLCGLSTDMGEFSTSTIAHIEIQIGLMANGPTEPGRTFCRANQRLQPHQLGACVDRLSCHHRAVDPV